MITGLDDDIPIQEDVLLNINVPEDKNVVIQSDFKAKLQRFATENLPTRAISNDSDLFDFLLTPDQHDMKIEELIVNLENLIFSKEEAPSAYLRIGKIFNYVSQLLENSIDTSDFFQNTSKLNEIRAFLDLFLRTLDGVRFTSFSKVCPYPEQQMQLNISEGLFTKVLTLATTKLHLLPEDTDTLLLRYILFVLESPAPYTTSIQEPYKVATKFFTNSLEKHLNKNAFHLLTSIFVSGPPSLLDTYLKEIILPLKSILEDNISKNVSKPDEIEDKSKASKSGSDANEEINYLILSVLISGLNNKSIKKVYIDSDVHLSFYKILRSTCTVFAKESLNLSTRNTRAIINFISNILPDLSQEKFAEARDLIFGDIAKCIGEKRIDFVLQNIIPLFSSANNSTIPVCLHFDEDEQKSLSQYRYRSPVASIGSSDNESFPLSSEILSTQERQVLLQNIEKLSILPKSDEELKNLHIDTYKWKRSFKVDYQQRYALSTAKIHEEIQKSQGVLIIFQCLIGDEVCKLGVYSSNKLAMANPEDVLLAHHYKVSESKLAFANKKNFAFFYTPNQKLHFDSTQRPAKKGDKPSDGRSQPSNAKDEPVFIEFSDSRIIAYVGGSSIIEYHPIRPEKNRITINPNKLISIEAQLGQKVNDFKSDTKGFSFVQSMECWVLNDPDNNENKTQEEGAADFQYIYPKIVDESVRSLRSKGLVMIPEELTFEQVFALIFKSNKNEVHSKINCKVPPQTPVDLGVQIGKVLELYQGRTQNILDLFLSSQDQTVDFSRLFEGRTHKVYQRFAKLASSKQSSLICRMLTVEKIREIMSNLTILASKNNKDFETDFVTISKEIEVFLTVDGFHRYLVEDEKFFLLLLKIIDVSIKEDFKAYQNNCMFFKLEKIAFKALGRVFEAKNKENFNKSNLQELIDVLLGKLAELPFVADLTTAPAAASTPADNDVKLGDLLEGGASHKNTNEEENTEKKAAESLSKQATQTKTRICKEIFQCVLTSVETLCEWDFDRKLKRDFMNKAKHLKLIQPISSIIGECNADNRKYKSNPFFQQLNCINLLILLYLTLFV